MTIAKISPILPTVVLVGISGFCGLKQNGWPQRYTLSTEMCELYCFFACEGEQCIGFDSPNYLLEMMRSQSFGGINNRIKR